MGIEGFSSWFKQQYPKAFGKYESSSFTHVYVDMASVLHNVLRKARTSNHFHFLLYAKLDNIMHQCNPSRSVVFAMDGPAPLAKLLTQRQRRIRESRKDSTSSQRATSGAGLTPGTPFMAEVQQSLAYYIAQRVTSPRYQHLQFELSGANVKGEGEQKILSRLLRPWAPVSVHDTHCIIASDSDMILMAMLADIPGVYVLLDDSLTPIDKRLMWQVLSPAGLASQPLRSAIPSHHRKGVRKKQSSFICFSVDALAAEWRAQHPNFFLTNMTEHTDQPTVEEGDSLINVSAPTKNALQSWRVLRGPQFRAMALDLVVMAVIGSGNDYLPPMQHVTLVGTLHSNLWTCYLAMRSSLEWSAQWLVEEREAMVQLNPHFMSELLRRCRPPSNQEMSGETLFPGLKPPADPGAYAKGLQWLLTMYTRGDCPDYRYTYEAVGPSACVFQRYLETSLSHNAAALLPKGASQSAQPGATGSLNPVACALALLPPKGGRRHAPSGWEHLMDPDSPIADLYRVCHECEAFTSQQRVLHKKMTTLLESVAKAKDNCKTLAVKDVDVEQIKEAEALLERQKAELRSCRSSVAALQDAQIQHLMTVHPYAPFPVDRLEAAVAAVQPKTGETMLQFGTPFCFSSEKAGLVACQCEACKGSHAKLASAKCIFAAPLPTPPVESLRELPADVRVACVPLPEHMRDTWLDVIRQGFVVPANDKLNSLLDHHSRLPSGAILASIEAWQGVPDVKSAQKETKGRKRKHPGRRGSHVTSTKGRKERGVVGIAAGSLLEAPPSKVCEDSRLSGDEVGTLAVSTHISGQLQPHQPNNAPISPPNPILDCSEAPLHAPLLQHPTWSNGAQHKSAANQGPRREAPQTPRILSVGTSSPRCSLASATGLRSNQLWGAASLVSRLPAHRRVSWHVSAPLLRHLLRVL
eukprot:jgi/Botrbrau1/13933/Bobra.0193s0001.1